MPPTILEFLDHPDVARHFPGDSWRPWRAFLAALFGLPMDEEAHALFRHHTARETAPDRPFREAALVVGRRGGKSRVLALIATYLAVFTDYKPHLAPGEMATVAVIAADRKQARTIFRYVEGLLAALTASKMMQSPVVKTRDEQITLKNSVVIEIMTASFRSTRGYSFAAVLADETAFWRDSETSANPDAEVFRALRPALTMPGAVLLNASSPYRKSGVLFGAFKRYFGRDDADVLVWRGTTAEMNAAYDPALIARAYEEDPVSAAAEHGAEFRGDIAQFVAREAVEACVEPGRYELPPVAGIRYTGFVDPSGGSADSMTLAIAHKAGDVGVLDALREVKPPFSPEAVVRDFAALLKSYKLTQVTGDRYAGEWPRERFREHGIAYVIADKTKVEIYRDSLPALNSGKLELLDLPRLVAQLCGLERRTARGGKDSVDHPPGGHDDLCNAAMGALLKTATARQPMKISSEALARASQPVPGSRGWGRRYG